MLVKQQIPSGYLTVRHGKSPFLIGKPSINEPFSMAMSNKQRVIINHLGRTETSIPPNPLAYTHHFLYQMAMCGYLIPHFQRDPYVKAEMVSSPMFPTISCSYNAIAMFILLVLPESMVGKSS